MEDKISIDTILDKMKKYFTGQSYNIWTRMDIIYG